MEERRNYAAMLVKNVLTKRSRTWLESQRIVETPPPLTSLDSRIEILEHQSQTILFLSAINLFANLLTVGVALLAVLP